MQHAQSRVINSARLHAHDHPTEFRGPAGVLEAVWSTPQASDTRTVAIICHPHPLHGGNLNNKITLPLARTFCGLGIQAVRLNFRGTGGSDGNHDGRRGETEDLLAVIRGVRAHQPDSALRIASFAFGAYVALQSAQRLDVDRLITVAPAFNLYDFSDLSSPLC